MFPFKGRLSELLELPEIEPVVPAPRTEIDINHATCDFEAASNAMERVASPRIDQSAGSAEPTALPRAEQIGGARLPAQTSDRGTGAALKLSDELEHLG
jgi:hypothetical protein